MTNTEFLKKYFWEYDLKSLDLFKHANFIINRVAKRCDFIDLKKLVEIFNVKKVIECIKSSLEITVARKNLILNILS